MLGISWPVALACLATWVVMAKVFKVSSLSALTAAVLAPLYMWLLEPAPVFWAMNLVIAVLLIWRHRSNIQRLLSGAESRIDKGKRG